MAKQTNTPEDWRILAERDLSVAEHLAATMTPVPTEIIAFHCQQTAEKYLKGAFIHDLDILCSLAIKHQSSFNSISSLCTIINYCSVQLSYDRGMNLSSEDMSTVLAHTKTIKEFLQKETPDLFS